MRGSLSVRRFPAPLEAHFRAARVEALAQINVTTFWPVAALVMIFSWWDWFVDPAHWDRAFAIRVAGSAVIVATGLTQWITRRVSWAPAISKVRYTAAVISVAAALAVLDRGYLVGIAGLVSVMLSAPYIAIDRRDLLVMNVLPLAATAAIMWGAGLDRFAVVNAAIFIVLAVAVSLLLARVFEASNRRAFALEQQLKHEARTDALTGLRNRRALEEIAGAELKRSARAGSPLALVICDIDRFKEINDRFGHDTGDRVIRAVSEQLASVARESDALGRWGGEEFLAILPDTDEAAALVLAERMRAVVEGATIPVASGLRVTISVGAAGVPGPGDPEPARWEAALRTADDAMYRAKAAGRNRVMAGRALPAGDAVRR